jgi:HEAT repeat protein/outer membrane protein assembly factor BamB
MRTRLAGPAAATLGLALLAATPAAEPEPDPDLAYAEKSLRGAGVGTDGPSLLRFFRDRTLSPEQRAGLAHAVSALADPSWAAREQASADLVRAGRSARALLRAAASDPDPERARRAARCLQRAESAGELSLAAAAARVLADRRPDGAADALLGYLPAAGDEALEETLFEALGAAGVRGGKADPALAAALADAEPLRRAAAASVLGRTPAGAPAVRPLLRDADARVRYEAAAALVRGGDRDAVPALVGLLGEGPLPLAWQAQEVLGRAAGERWPAVLTGGDAGERRKARDAWAAWWRDNAGRVELAKVDWQGALLGLNLVCDSTDHSDRGTLWQCGADGRALWEMDVSVPVDAQPLPGGRLLVAEFRGSQVSERDRSGKVLWSHRVNALPTTCQRLPNGNTFIATYGELFEVTPDGKRVLALPSPGNQACYRAHKLRNGHVLLASGSNRVIELDGTGKEVRSVPMPGNAAPWASVEPLPGGRLLVGMYGADKVVELDGAGKVLWEVKVQSPSSASRLPNGHTLVSSMNANKVVEFDRDGKAVWEQKTKGRPFLVRRY